MKQLVGILLNPKNMKGTLSNEFVRGWSAYDIAVKNGFEGTEEDFIDSLKGETIDLRVVGTLLQYKHENDEEWSDLVDLNGLDYELMSNLPTVNGTDYVLTAADKAEIAGMVLPALPSTDGSYILTVTISNGEPTYIWQLQS